MPTSPTVSYDSVVFEHTDSPSDAVGNHFVRTRMNIKPVRTPDDREVLYTDIVVEVETWLVSDDPPVGELIDTYKRILMTPGLKFTLQDKVYGTIEVGGDAALKDAAYGPWPLDCSIKPLGGENAAFVTWKVKVALPRCLDSASRLEGLAGLSMEVTHAFDPDTQMMRETVTGELVIAAAAEDGRPHLSADDWRERLKNNSRPPLGFRPIEKSFNLSADRRTLKYAISHEQLNRALPEHVLTMKSAHSERLSFKDGKFKKSTCTITAAVTTAPGAKRSSALLAFLRLVEYRMARRRAIQRTGKCKIIEMAHVYEESDLYHRPVSNFSYVATVHHLASLETILQRSGLWAGVGTTHAAWVASMDDDKAFEVRGRGALKMPDDVPTLITMCDGQGGSGYGLRPVALPDRTIAVSASGEEVNPDAAPGSVGAMLPSSLPGDYVSGLYRPKPASDPVGSAGPGFGLFVGWEATLELQEDRSLYTVKGLPTRPLRVEGNPEPRRLGPGLSSGQRPALAAGALGVTAPAGLPPNTPLASGKATAINTIGAGMPGFREQPNGSVPDDLYFEAGGSNKLIVLKGMGIRYGMTFAQPALVRFGGRPVVEKSRRIEYEVEHLPDGTAFFGVVWRIEYTISGGQYKPAPLLANPATGFDGRE